MAWQIGADACQGGVDFQRRFAPPGAGPARRLGAACRVQAFVFDPALLALDSRSPAVWAREKSHDHPLRDPGVHRLHHD